ncbi:hypothetical protein SAMN05216413_1645 [Ruminococcaceae bacterium KH2T8]|nr:hypothetical protein SAMN05216413_1645 [Ruminococcaceae bacterium KH2T8]
MPLKQQRRMSSSAKMFIVAVIALLYCPFFNVMFIGNGYIGDAMIQIRIGLDMIAKKGLIVNDIYSWHQNLNWYPHEEAWYFVVGLAYKLGGIAGVIILTAIFNYTMAAIIFKKNLETVNSYILVLTAAIARCFSFPNYNARPHLASQLIFVVFVYIMLEDKISILKKCIAFSVCSFLMAWFHGGMIPLFFVVFGVFIAIEVVFKQFKIAGKYLLGLLAGAVASLLNPIGVGVWTYALMQSQGSDVWKYNMEWQPKTFSVIEISALLLIFVGFAVDERLRNFDKKVITKLCFYCLFIIISCKYCRFMNFTALVIVMFCGEELAILLDWLNRNITKLDTKKFRLGDISNYILTAFCVGFMFFTTVFSWITYFPTNTVSDISGIAAYDEGVISVVREKGYSRIYNSFNSGTWLAFYGIPVHIDNRTDLYLAEFSGEDYITNKMLIADIDEMNGFVDEYHPDALVLDLEPGTTDEYFAEDLYTSERYNVIYDNTVVSTYDGKQTYRWMVVEVVD